MLILAPFVRWLGWSEVEKDPDVGDGVTFISSGVEFGGTLALMAQDLSQPGVDYQMISSHVATGTFIVTGDNQFDEVIQDAFGFVGRRY